jgi:glyoxylase-like metal-dependent hydrolase (beta-lactamase superfamily II)
MFLQSIEGNRQRLDGGAMFGNAPKALWERWFSTDSLNRVELACRALLVIDDSGRKILFETGIGDFFEPKMSERFGVETGGHRLTQNLLAAGHELDSIDIVVLSHLHFDHAGGLLSSWQDGVEPTLVFPNAKFVVSEAGWERCKNPHQRDRASFIPALTRLLEQSGRLHIETQEHSTLLGDGFRFHFSNGHTVGLMMTEIETPKGPLAIVADLIPGVAWVRVPITMGYDRYPELLIDEKRALLDDLFARDGWLYFTHDPETSVAQIHRNQREQYCIDHIKAAAYTKGLSRGTTWEMKR